MSERLILTGGMVITPDGMYESGSVVIEGAQIAAISPRTYLTGSASDEITIDVRDQFILPGLICLHNDAIEKAINPRPGANFPADLALLSLDRALATAGVTTQFHALSFYGMPGKERTIAWAEKMRETITTFQASRYGLVDHYVLFRCDVRQPGSLDAILAHIDDGPVKLVSLDDHVPGQGQMRDVARAFAQLQPDLRPDMTEEAWQAERVAFMRASEGQIAQTYKRVSHAAHTRGFTLMSHDDDTIEKVEAMSQLGCRIAEFPVTVEAARHAHAVGMRVSVGAPNVVRGGSLSGNINAVTLAREGLIDILIADYHAPSLLPAAFRLAREGVMSLPEAVAMITATPAGAAMLTDRGALEPGQRADVIVVRMQGEVPVVTQLFRAGEAQYMAPVPLP